MNGRFVSVSLPASAYAHVVARQHHTAGTTRGNSRSKPVARVTQHNQEPLNNSKGSVRSARNQQQPGAAASAAGRRPAAKQQRYKGSSSSQQPLQPHQQQLSEHEVDTAQDPLLASTRWQSWQQRQQPKQRQEQRRPHQQRRAGTSAAAGLGSKQARRSLFAQYSTYQAVLDALNHLQQQRQQQAAPDVCQTASQKQQRPAAPLLDAAESVCLLEQLAAISNTSSSGSVGVGNSSSFVEDQALQQLLPMAYYLLQQHASSSSSPSTTAISSRDLLCCISSLASLKYSMPAQLAPLLEKGPAGCKAGLAGLHTQQLASLIANLARAGVRPSNAWLVAFMQEAQRRFPSAKLAQLSQLLSGLVRMGVKPAASWLDALQDQAIQHLVEQAVRVQVEAGQLKQQGQEQQESMPSADVTPVTASAAVSATGTEDAMSQRLRSSSSSSSSRRMVAGCQLHDIAQLLSALAEAQHVPKPQLAAALWGATAASLAVADTASLVELLGASGDLQLVPPVGWMRQYYGSTIGALQAGQYRPWQLARSVAAVGKLIQAGMTVCTETECLHPQQQQLLLLQQRWQQGAESGVAANSSSSTAISCSQWVAVALEDVHSQLAAFAARDLAALLSGLASLSLPLAAGPLVAICEEAKVKLARLNTAGMATLLAAVVDLDKQQQQQQHGVLLTEDWMEAFLREAAVKLPMFPANDLAAVLLALQASTLKPSKLWLEAAAAQLHSKLTVLTPASVVHVLDSLISMGHVPGHAWVASAIAALEARVVDLHGEDLQVLLQALVAVGSSPSAMLLNNAHWVVLQLGHQALEQSQQQFSSGPGGENLAAACQQLLKQLENSTGSAATVSSIARVV